MPTYEYQCPDGHVFEKFQKMTDKPRAKCPVCGKLATRKISGGAGLVFKGSGFYITDYRGEGYKKAAEGDKGASSSGGGESKSEPAAAPKPESKSSGSSSSGGSSAGGASKSE